MNDTHTEPIPNPLRQQGGFNVPPALVAEKGVCAGVAKR